MSDISGKIGSLDDLNDDNHLDLVKNEIAEIASNEEIVFDDYEENDFDVASASSLDDLLDDNADQFPLNDFDQQQGGSGAKKGFFASLFRQPEEPLNSLDVDSVAYNDEFNASDLEIISDYSNEAEFRADVTETESDSFTEASMVIEGGVAGKITTVLVGLLILSIAAISFTSAFLSREALTVTINEATTTETELLADLVTAFFVEVAQPLYSATSTNAIIEVANGHLDSYVDSEGNPLSETAIIAQLEAQHERWISSNDSDPVIQQILSKQNNVASRDLEMLANNFAEYGQIVITDKYSAVVAASKRVPEYYKARQNWWQAAWNNGEGAVFISQPQYDVILDSEAVDIAMPIRDASGNIVGIAGATVSLGVLSSHIEEYQFAETGYAVLINSEANTVVDPGLQLGEVNNDLASDLKQIFLNTPSGVINSPDAQGENTVFSHVSISDHIAEHSDEENTGAFVSQLMSAVSNLDWRIFIRIKAAEAYSALNPILTASIAVGLVTLLIALLIAVEVAKGISKPIRQLASLSNRVASGDLSKLANVQSTDEVGYLAQSFNTAIQRLRGIVTTEEERDREREQREELQANVGDFLDVAMDIANGDLTQRGKVSEDVLGNVIDAINLMLEEVAYLLQDVQIAALSVNSGSQEMIQTTEAITQSTLQQSQEAQQATQEVAEVTKSIREMAENAQTSAEASQQAFLASEQGQEAVTNTLGGMQNIRREVQSISKRIKSLGDRSLEISEIVDTISGITRQTNLLALNAAIEASGAGEAGRRFAIVADEVRKLADDSAKATERIAGLIKNVQAEVQEVVISVEDGTREVETGYRVATEAGQRLKEIGDISQRSAQLAQLISQATQAQVEGVEQVGNKVTSIAGIAEASQTNVEQGRDVAQNLQELAEKLAQSLERFRIA